MAIKQLILGGARSGKSRYAEQCAKMLSNQPENNNGLIYLATASAGDAEMSQRIRHHQARRDRQWQLIEEPINIATTIQQNPSTTILIDCLTLWVSNCLSNHCWERQRSDVLDALEQSNSNIIMVSNQVGSGIVPMGALTRQFVDESGWLHQQLAERCSHVNLTVAGLPLALKGPLLCL